MLIVYVYNYHIYNFVLLYNHFYCLNGRLLWLLLVRVWNVWNGEFLTSLLTFNFINHCEPKRALRNRLLSYVRNEICSEIPVGS